MPTAALYDIHGNLPALQAVLEEIEQHGVDQLVAGGDVIIGPMSRECLETLLEPQISTHFIKGNCETSVLAQANGHSEKHLPESVQEDIRWTADQLQAQHFEEIAKWPISLSLNIEGIGKVLFCHATTRNEHEIFTKLTAESKLLPLFDSLEEDLVVCGHTHMQFDRQVGATRIINAGSIGMPFGKPGAYWLLLGQEVELQRTAYDLEGAAEQILQTSYPHAKDFAEKSILNPPTEEAMLELFTRSELQ